MSLNCKTLGKVLGLQLHARLDKGEWRCNTSTKVTNSRAMKTQIILRMEEEEEK